MNREEIIGLIKLMGNEMIERAEEFVGTDPFFVFKMDIHIDGDDAPTVKINKDFYPLNLCKALETHSIEEVVSKLKGDK